MPQSAEEGPHASRWPSWIAAAAREPLTHFVLAGALIFLAYAGTQSLRRPAVRIGETEIAQLAGYWAAQSGRAPTQAELRGMVEERIDEEIMADEARRLGLDADDVILRRRLAQKYAFVREDLETVPEPDDATLRAYLAAHADQFATEATVALRQIFFSAERPDARAAADAAARTLARAPERTVDGDPFIMPLSYAAIASRDIERDYGAPFSRAVLAAPTGKWIGPLQTAYGWHLVRVEAREAAHAPDFATIREAVRGQWMEEERQRRRERNRAELRRRYRIELPKGFAL